MRIQSAAPDFHRPGYFDYVIQLFNKNPKLVYTEYTKDGSTKNYSVKVATEGDFLPAAEFNESNPIDFQDFETPYRAEYFPLSRGIGFASTWLALEADYWGIIKNRAQKMNRAIVKAMEADVANFINLATSTATPNAATTPDGLSLASTAHLYALGTYSNVTTGNPPVGINGLTTAVQEIMLHPTHTGDPMMIQGPYNWIVPTAQADLANRIVRTQKYPTTNDNDINWAGGFVNKVIVNPYLTSTTAHMLVPASDEDNPLEVVWRRKPRVKEQEAIEFDGIKFTTTAVWVKVPNDWRGVAYSAGA